MRAAEGSREQQAAADRMLAIEEQMRQQKVTPGAPVAAPAPAETPKPPAAAKVAATAKARQEGKPPPTEAPAAPTPTAAPSPAPAPPTETPTGRSRLADTLSQHDATTRQHWAQQMANALHRKGTLTLEDIPAPLHGLVDIARVQANPQPFIRLVHHKPSEEAGDIPEHLRRGAPAETHKVVSEEKPAEEKAAETKVEEKPAEEAPKAQELQEKAVEKEAAQEAGVGNLEEVPRHWVKRDKPTHWDTPKTQAILKVLNLPTSWADAVKRMQGPVLAVVRKIATRGLQSKRIKIDETGKIHVAQSLANVLRRERQKQDREDLLKDAWADPWKVMDPEERAQLLTNAAGGHIGATPGEGIGDRPIFEGPIPLLKGRIADQPAEIRQKIAALRERKGTVEQVPVDTISTLKRVMKVMQDQLDLWEDALINYLENDPKARTKYVHGVSDKHDIMRMPDVVRQRSGSPQDVYWSRIVQIGHRHNQFKTWLGEYEDPASTQSQRQSALGKIRRHMKWWAADEWLGPELASQSRQLESQFMTGRYAELKPESEEEVGMTPLEIAEHRGARGAIVDEMIKSQREAHTEAAAEERKQRLAEDRAREMAAKRGIELTPEMTQEQRERMGLGREQTETQRLEEEQARQSRIAQHEREVSGEDEVQLVGMFEGKPRAFNRVANYIHDYLGDYEGTNEARRIAGLPTYSREELMNALQGWVAKERYQIEQLNPKLHAAMLEAAKDPKWDKVSGEPAVAKSPTTLQHFASRQAQRLIELGVAEGPDAGNLRATDLPIEGLGVSALGEKLMELGVVTKPELALIRANPSADSLDWARWAYSHLNSMRRDVLRTMSNVISQEVSKIRGAASGVRPTEVELGQPMTTRYETRTEMIDGKPVRVTVPMEPEPRPPATPQPAHLEVLDNLAQRLRDEVNSGKNFADRFNDSIKLIMEANENKDIQHFKMFKDIEAQINEWMWLHNQIDRIIGKIDDLVPHSREAFEGWRRFEGERLGTRADVPLPRGDLTMEGDVRGLPAIEVGPEQLRAERIAARRAGRPLETVSEGVRPVGERVVEPEKPPSATAIKDAVRYLSRTDKPETAPASMAEHVSASKVSTVLEHVYDRKDPIDQRIRDIAEKQAGDVTIYDMHEDVYQALMKKLNATPYDTPSYYHWPTDSIFLRRGARRGIGGDEARSQDIRHEIGHALTFGAIEMNPAAKAAITRLTDIVRSRRSYWDPMSSPARRQLPAREGITTPSGRLGDAIKYREMRGGTVWSREGTGRVAFETYPVRAERETEVGERHLGEPSDLAREEMATRLEDPHEFIQEIQANKSFRRLMAGVPLTGAERAQLRTPRGRTVWDAAKEWIRRAVTSLFGPRFADVKGVRGRGDALSDALTMTFEILQDVADTGRRPYPGADVYGGERRTGAAAADYLWLNDQRNKKMEVYKNPDIYDIRRIARESRFNEVRVMRDRDTGDVYAFDGDRSTHNDIESQIGGQYGDQYILKFENGKLRIPQIDDKVYQHPFGSEKELRQFLGEGVRTGAPGFKGEVGPTDVTMARFYNNMAKAMDRKADEQMRMAKESMERRRLAGKFQIVGPYARALLKNAEENRASAAEYRRLRAERMSSVRTGAAGFWDTTLGEKFGKTGVGKEIKYRYEKQGGTWGQRTFWAQTLYDLTQWGPQAFREKTRPLLDNTAELYTLARQYAEKRGDDALIKDIAAFQKLPQADKAADFLIRESKHGAYADDDLYTGKNAHVRKSLLHRQVARIHDNLRTELAQLERDIPGFKEFRNKLHDWAREAARDDQRAVLNDTAAMDPVVYDSAGNVDTTAQSAFVKYLINDPSDPLTSAEQAWIDKMRPNPKDFSGNAATDAFLNRMKFDKLVQSYRDNPDLARRAGPWVPFKRFGDFAVSGRYNFPTLPLGARDLGDGVFEFGGADARTNAERFIDAVTDSSGVKLLHAEQAVYDKTTGEPATRVEEHSTWEGGKVGEPGYIVTTREGQKRITARQAVNDPNLEVRWRLHFNDRHLEFFRKETEAQDALNELRKNPHLTMRDEVELVSDRKNYQSPHLMSKAMSDMIKQLKNSWEYKRMTDAERRAWLQRLQQQSAKQVMMAGGRAPGLMREYVEGQSRNLLEGYAMASAQSAFNHAHYTYGGKYRDALKEAEDFYKSWTGKGTSDMRAVLEEIQRRMFRVQDPFVHGIWGAATNRLLQATYTAKLAGTSFLALNLMEPILIGLPYLASKYGAWNAFRLMRGAYRDIGIRNTLGEGVGDFKTAMLSVMNKGKQATWADYQHVLTKYLKDPDEIKLFETLMKRGLFDRNSVNEVTMLRQPNPGRIGKFLDYWDTAFRGMNTSVEALNRGVLALAAFRGEKGTFEQRLRGAEDAVYKGAGQYASWNAPPAFNHPVARLALQFKKYPQRVLSNYIAALAGTMHGETPEIRRQNLKHLAYSLGMTASVAGMFGLPTEVFSVPMNALNILGIGPGWQGVQSGIYELMANYFGPETAEILAHGLPRALNIDMSTRAGQDSLLFFGDPVSNKQQDLKASLAGISLGAGGSTIFNTIDGIQNLGKALSEAVSGSNEMAWQYGTTAARDLMVVRQIADILEAYRKGSGDIRNRGGTAMGPELTAGETFMRGLGVTSGREARYWEARRVEQAAEKGSQADRNTWTTRYATATPSERPRILASIAEWNNTHGTADQIKASDLTKAVAHRRREEARPRTEMGLPRNRRFASERERVREIYNVQ